MAIFSGQLSRAMGSGSLLAPLGPYAAFGANLPVSMETMGRTDVAQGFGGRVGLSRNEPTAATAGESMGGVAGLISNITGLLPGRSQLSSNFSGMMPGSFGVQSNLPPQYRQAIDRGGRYSGATPIPTMGAQIRPVIATETGEAPGLGPFGGRRGSPTGITYQNPTEVVSSHGITSAYTQGQLNPYRKQLYGDLGPTASHTLLLHPEKYKSLTSGSSGMAGKNWTSGPQSNLVARGLSMMDTRYRPGQGTAEGQRYTDTVRKEIAGANMVFDPLTGEWGNRNMFRSQLNNMMTGRAMGKKPPSVEYRPNEAWKARLHGGVAKEHTAGEDVGPSIETYEEKKSL